MGELITSKGNSIPHRHVQNDGHIVWSPDSKDICYPISKLYRRFSPSSVDNMLQDNTDDCFARWEARDAHFRLVDPFTPSYNCIGKVFGGKEIWIRPKQVADILKDDEYYPVIQGVKPGDVVIYRSTRALEHAGFVHCVEADGTVIVQSKWGMLADFIHRIASVPDDYGTGIVMRTDVPESLRTKHSSATT